MRQLLYFAIAALVIAGVMPRVMSQVGKHQVSEARPAKRVESAAPRATINDASAPVIKPKPPKSDPDLLAAKLNDSDAAPDKNKALHSSSVTTSRSTPLVTAKRIAK